MFSEKYFGSIKSGHADPFEANSIALFDKVKDACCDKVPTARISQIDRFCYDVVADY